MVEATTTNWEHMASSNEVIRNHATLIWSVVPHGQEFQSGVLDQLGVAEDMALSYIDSPDIQA